MDIVDNGSRDSIHSAKKAVALLTHGTRSARKHSDLLYEES